MHTKRGIAPIALLLILLMNVALACAPLHPFAANDECEDESKSIHYEPGFEPHTGVIEEWFAYSGPVSFDELMGVTGTGLDLQWSDHTTGRIFLYAEGDYEEIAGIEGSAIEEITEASSFDYDYVTPSLGIGGIGVLRNLETGYYGAARLVDKVDRSYSSSGVPSRVTLRWFFAGPSDDFSVFRQSDEN